MGADEWSIEHGYRYTQWMLGGNVVIMLLFVINAVFRGAGDAAIAMRVLIVANLLNMALDPLLIFGWGPIPAMGIEGAAIATNIGRSVGVLLQLWVLLKGGQHIRVGAAQLGNLAAALNILHTSLGGIGQMLVGMTAWIFLMRILASVSNEAVAGATIALRIMMFTLMPAWGPVERGGHSGGTESGRRSAGTGGIQRMENRLLQHGVHDLCVSDFFFWHDPLIALFTDDQAVIAIGGDWLQILSYSYFVYGWWMVSTQAFNGAGDTMTPTKINLVFF